MNFELNKFSIHLSKHFILTMKRFQNLALVLIALCLVAGLQASVLRGQFTRAEDSCEGRCNQTGTIPGVPCQCNSACLRYNDCCSDYESLCLVPSGSCVGRCHQSGTIPGACQCNKPCVDYGDCCPDYSDVCLPESDISDEELEEIAEQLLVLEGANNANQFIRVDLQQRSSGNNDMAPNPLLTVTALAFEQPTIQKLIMLHDNYEPSTSVRETHTPEEEAEIDDFINEVFNTPVMQIAQAFLRSHDLPNGKEKFYELWFELYTRGNGIVSSSGFEHVFVGELSSSGVSGFHNWEYFCLEERNTYNGTNYMGYAEYVDFGSKGSVIEHTFEWRNRDKPVSSMFIGTSPELELALYTVCFHARPNAKCPIQLNGQKIKIQTYTIGTRGQNVGTAYPDLSDNE